MKANSQKQQAGNSGERQRGGGVAETEPSDERDQADEEVTACPECGMEKEDWPEPEGYTRDGNNYCCRGCADGTGCTCA